MSANQRGVYEHPRGSNIWHINYYDAAGKRHREKVGPKSSAVEAYRMRKTQIRLSNFFPPQRQKPKITFGELVNQAMDEKHARLAPLTMRADSIRMKKLLADWKHMLAEEVAAPLIERKMRAMKQAGLSGSTVNRYRSLLSSIFSFADRAGILPGNPVAKVKRYKENEARIRFLEEGEEREIRRVVRREYPEREQELDLALHTGMRRGEQFQLKWEAVDLGRGILTVRGKTGRRFLPINSAAGTALKILYSRTNGSGYVTPEAKRAGQRDWRRWFEDALVLAKVDNFTWHDLRHTFASRLVMEGVPLRTVQTLLGHKSITMTERYAHLAPDHQRAAVEKLATATRTATDALDERQNVLEFAG